MATYGGTFTRTFDEIVQLTLDAQRKQSPMVSRMRDILDRYDGEWVLPMPELPNEPTMPPLTPALVGEVIDKAARRAASVPYASYFPAIDSNKPTGKRSIEFAGKRRGIVSAVEATSKWKLGIRRAYRQLSAYHTCSTVVVPDFKLQLPSIEVRDPLASFVEPAVFESVRQPSYGGFLTRYSGEWLRRMYPKVKDENGGPISCDQTGELWDVVEFYDEEQVCWGLVGPVRAEGDHIAERAMGAPFMCLHDNDMPYVNKAGVVPITQPHNLSLGKISSRIGQLLGNIDLQARLLSLDIQAQEQAVFPDTWILGGDNGETPELIDGEWKDGREGGVNRIRGAKGIGVLRTTPDQRTGQMVDRLERNVRISTDLLPQSGGENWGSLRTGRAMDSMTSFAVDPGTQELHEIMEAWLPHQNVAILATFKGYWGRKSYSMSTGRATDREPVVFVPNEHIENYENTVNYAIPGADITTITQILGSLVGAGFMSQRSARNRHPMIEDGDAETLAVEMERAEEAFKRAVYAKIESGELPLTLGSRILKSLAAKKSILEAVDDAQTWAQQQQATQAPPAPEGMVAPPEAMLGLEAGPGAAVQQPLPPQDPTIQPPPAGVSNMRSLMEAMV